MINDNKDKNVNIGMKHNVEDNKHNYEVQNLNIIKNKKRTRVDRSKSHERDKKERLKNNKRYINITNISKKINIIRRMREYAILEREAKEIKIID